MEDHVLLLSIAMFVTAMTVGGLVAWLMHRAGALSPGLVSPPDAHGAEGNGPCDGR